MVFLRNRLALLASIFSVLVFPLVGTARGPILTLEPSVKTHHHTQPHRKGSWETPFLLESSPDSVNNPSIYLQGRGGGDAADEMMITIASDISLGTWTGSGGVSGTSAICVYHTGGSSYSITLTTSTANFRVENGANYVTYTPSFSDSGVRGTYTALSYGVTQSFSGANTSSSSCSGRYNAALKIEVDEADLSSAQPGSYSATLTLVLTPS